MMFFSMNSKKRIPLGMQTRFNILQQSNRQIVAKPIVMPVVKAVTMCDVVNISTSDKIIITYNIGCEDEGEDVNNTPPVPVVEEPVIETLSKPLEKIVEEEEKEKDEDEEEEEKKIVEDKKKKKKNNKKVRK
jgi:translation initiation factor IF-2